MCTPPAPYPHLANGNKPMRLTIWILHPSTVVRGHIGEAEVASALRDQIALYLNRCLLLLAV